MLYYLNGRVLPERTNVYISYIRKEIPDIGTITFMCDSSQIIMSIDTQIDKLSAYLLCKHHATIIVSSLGFVKGCSYSIELISITDENLDSTFIGVQTPELEEIPNNPLFSDVLNFSYRDIFFRFAIMDYTKSFSTEIELPFLCYRAIESIKSRFLINLREQNKDSRETEAWDLMHNSLNTNKEEIMEVKKFSDPIRHGNYYTLIPTNSNQRFQILSITKNIILKYKQFLENKIT